MVRNLLIPLLGVVAMMSNVCNAQTNHFILWRLFATYDPMTISVGDMVEFDFTEVIHTVVEMESIDCTFFGERFEFSPAIFQFDTPGTFYYGCDVGDHCAEGMAIEINVVGTAGDESGRLEPSPDPSSAPAPDPSSAPAPDPSPAPSSDPSSAPSPDPSSAPSGGPTDEPTSAPTDSPIDRPTVSPVEDPTLGPSQKPTDSPTLIPSEKPTDTPTTIPSEKPTEKPNTLPPSPVPTVMPSVPPPTPAPLPSQKFVLMTTQSICDADSMENNVLRVDTSLDRPIECREVCQNDALCLGVQWEKATDACTLLSVRPTPIEGNGGYKCGVAFILEFE